MRCDFQQILMTATVVQPAEWHDGVDDEQGYALFTVRNAISTRFLKDAEPLEYSVVCFGNSGLKSLPYLVKGQTVIFNGQEISWRIGRVVVVPWVRVCGMDFDFEVEELYRSAEEAQIFQKQINASLEPSKTTDESPKCFNTFEEVLQAVGCECGFNKWLKYRGVKVIEFCKALFPDSTRDRAYRRFRKRIIGDRKWQPEELNRVYDILSDIAKKPVQTPIQIPKYAPIKAVDTDNLKTILKMHGLTQQEVGEQVFSEKINAGIISKSSAQALFRWKLANNKFTDQERGKLDQIVYQQNTSTTNTDRRFVSTPSPPPPKRVSVVGAPPIPTFSALESREEMYD